MSREPTNLEQLLDRIGEAAEGQDRVAIVAILEAIGRRSFGPQLLMAGVILVTPLSGVPGLPTAMGILVAAVSLQLLLRRRHIWLPRWILRSGFRTSKLDKVLGWLRRPARGIDRLLRPRLHPFVNGASTQVIAVLCLIIAVALPAMEFVPFSSSVAGAALAAFGLALVAHDGGLALLAYGFTAATVGVVVTRLV